MAISVLAFIVVAAILGAALLPIGWLCALITFMNATNILLALVGAAVWFALGLIFFRYRPKVILTAGLVALLGLLATDVALIAHADQINTFAAQLVRSNLPTPWLVGIFYSQLVFGGMIAIVLLAGCYLFLYARHIYQTTEDWRHKFVESFRGI